MTGDSRKTPTAFATSSSAEEMRRRFDAVFAAPPVEREVKAASFLALRVGGDGFVLRVRDLTGLAAAAKIVPLPGGAAVMLGLAGIRGLVVPVFSLSALMGYGSEPPHWLALCAGEGGDTLALAFSDFDGYLEAPVSGLRAVDADASRPERGPSFVREVVQGAGELRGVVDLASAVKAAYGSVPRQDR